MKNKCPGLLALLYLLLTTFIPAHAQESRIIIDGEFDDWSAILPAYTDRSGDQVSGLIDFKEIRIANDDRYIFLMVDVGTVIDFQEENSVRLSIDADDDGLTGSQTDIAGTEIEWTFGLRSGRFFAEHGEQPLYRSVLGLVVAPSVNAQRFEIAIRRDLRLDSRDVFHSDVIRLVLSDIDGKDRIPDIGDTVRYTFDHSPVVPLQIPALHNNTPDAIRIMTYNSRRGALFADSLQGAYSRILTALQPDIIGFQELYDFDRKDVQARLDSIYPLKRDANWHTWKTFPDIVIASRYPIKLRHDISGQNGAFLLDLPTEFPSDIVLVVAHLPCCEKDAERQREVDAIMAFIRDSKKNVDFFPIEANTPFIIMGDLNLVGSPRQLSTILEGRIADTLEFGPRFAPDWNGEALRAVRTPTTGIPFTYTWQPHLFSAWSPARLDYIIYSSATLKAHKALALFTEGLPSDTLLTYGLQSQDATLASDHLPVIADFTLKTTSSSGAPREHFGKPAFELEHLSENPDSRAFLLELSVHKPEKLHFEVVDIRGTCIADTYQWFSPGRHSVRIFPNRSFMPTSTAVLLCRVSNAAGESIVQTFLFTR